MKKTFDGSMSLAEFTMLSLVLPTSVIIAPLLTLFLIFSSMTGIFSTGVHIKIISTSAATDAGSDAADDRIPSLRAGFKLSRLISMPAIKQEG
jgi:hypothetical protein